MSTPLTNEELAHKKDRLLRMIGLGCNECTDRPSEVLRMVEEIERLRGIVEKLPKTADGKSLLTSEPNEYIYVDDNGSIRQIESGDWFLSPPTLAHESNGWCILETDNYGFEDNYGVETDVYLLSDVYSTREAAEAALAAKPAS